jgi:hypothetical protein
MALVMHRSGVRFPEAAPRLALSDARSQLDHLRSGLAGTTRVPLSGQHLVQPLRDPVEIVIERPGLTSSVIAALACPADAARP